MMICQNVPRPFVRPAYVWDRDSQSWFLWLFKYDKHGDRFFDKLTFTPNKEMHSCRNY